MEARFEENLVNFVHHIGTHHVVFGQAAFLELLFFTTRAIFVRCWHINYLDLIKTLIVWINIQIVVLSQRSYSLIEFLKIILRRLLFALLGSIDVLSLRFVTIIVFFLLFHILVSIYLHILHLVEKHLLVIFLFNFLLMVIDITCFQFAQIAIVEVFFKSFVKDK